jgi:hypothetical protein
MLRRNQMTNKAEWAKLLPVIEAFVSGKAIQKMGYNGRWENTCSMYSVLTTEYRVTPEDTIKGLWTVEFTETTPGAVDGPKKSGTMVWYGSSKDTPPWKWTPYLVEIKGTERFT